MVVLIIIGLLLAYATRYFFSNLFSSALLEDEQLPGAFLSDFQKNAYIQAPKALTSLQATY